MKLIVVIALGIWMFMAGIVYTVSTKERGDSN